VNFEDVVVTVRKVGLYFFPLKRIVVNMYGTLGKNWLEVLSLRYMNRI